MEDYIVFINSNDWFELDAIETKYNIIQNKDLDMVRFYYQINVYLKLSYTNVKDFEKIFYPKKKKGFWNIKSIELKIN